MLTLPAQDESITVESCLISVRSGFSAVLDHQSGLGVLAMRCGQAGAMDQLEFVLSSARLRRKFPHLLLLLDTDQRPFAAVLLFEYRIGGLRSGIFIPSDFGGERTVIAPGHLRHQVATRIAEFLLEKGALLVLLSVKSGNFASDNCLVLPEINRKWVCATQIREIQRTLELGHNYDGTLAKLGHDTRRNFRRHTRRIIQEFGAVFVDRPEITESDFLELNRQSAFPTSTRMAKWRFQVARESPNSIFVGLRSAAGQWLSILGGRRQGDLADVDWQLNHRGLERYSLVTAMRALLLQMEVDRGTRYLRFDGGTPHTMRFSFAKERIGDLLFVRSPRFKLALFTLLPYILPPDNLLFGVMISKEWTWHVAPCESRLMNPIKQE